MLFRAVDAGRREDFFKRTVLSVLALTSITEFVLNLRPLGLRQGDFFGEFSLLDGQPHSATVVADGNLTVFRLKRSAFVKVLSNEPTIAMGVVAGLAGRLRRGANE
jgi:CRP-like cAMP-binding protein